MKRKIKKFSDFINENFDTEELKAFSEIEYLTGQIDFTEIVNIEKFEINRILDMLSYKFPLFSKLTTEKQLSYYKEGSTITYKFLVEKEGFELPFLIKKQGEKLYTISIALKGPDFDTENKEKMKYKILSVENEPINIENSHLRYLRDKVIFEKWTDLNTNFVYDIIERRYLKYLDFIGRKDLINYNKNSIFNLEFN
jgi:hypothetical protein